MSRFNRPPGFFAAGMIFTSSLLFSLGSMVGFAKSVGEEVFNTKMSGYEVMYEENRYNPRSLFSPGEEAFYDKMTVTKDGIIHILIDKIDRKPIDSEVLSYHDRSKLEQITIITSKGEKKVYYASERNDPYVDIVFRNENISYNRFKAEWKQKIF